MDQLTRVPDEFMGRESRPWLKSYPADVPSTLQYPAHAMPWLLERAANNWPDRIACIYYDEKITYQRMLSRARRIALWLVEQGLQPGERVGVLLPNTPEYPSILNGIWLAGGVAVALSPLFVPEEATAFAEATQCKIVITLDVLSPLIIQNDSHPRTIVYSSLGSRMSRLERLGYAWVRLMRLGLKGVGPEGRNVELRQILREGRRKEDGFDPVAVNSSDRAYILPTGGTTSAPKAVTLTHGNLMANAWQISHWAGNKAGEETVLSVLPFFHSYGLSTCLTNGIALGATLVLHHRFRTTSVVRLMEQHQPTLFPAVPAMLAALNPVLENMSKKPSHSLKAVISGGAPLPASVSGKFSELTGAEVVEGYGLSEASPVTHAGPLDGTAISGTIGLPFPDTDARIVDAATGTEELPFGEVGELVIRGPQVMEGYWNNPEATADVLRDGWLYTGDLGTCDENGFFKIVDRKKDLIITSGFNVYPGDVEEVLLRYPGIKEVAVVGVPDERKGEIVKAVVVMEPGKAFNKDDFNAYAHKHLSAQKRPRIVEEQTQELPRNFLGKVLRRELRKNDEIHTET
ncbi:MAG TPA: long-chain fatty acid--CoA ligase [Planctomicrobium sp.]|nr:long-chain fatty acid--CoA ligase [Planctomicrobium sp.]